MRLLFTALLIAGMLAGVAQSADKGAAKGGAKPDSVKMKKADTAAVKLKPQQTCPVMGDPIDKKLFTDYNGKRIYVCMSSCLVEVKKDPEKYIKKLEGMGEGVETIGAVPSKAAKAEPAVKETKPAAEASAKTAEAGYYTCPMHPEVRQAEPGRCPKCGMNLVFKKEEKDTTKTKPMNHGKMKM